MENELKFKEALKMAEDVIERFEKIEGKKWGVEGALIELVKQAGELSRSVMVLEGYYFKGRGELDERYVASKGGVAGELADVLYSVIRIARHYGIDLEAAFVKARREESDFLKSRGV